MAPSQRKTPSYKHIMVCLRPKWWHHHINILYCVALQEWDTIIKTHYIVSPFKRETPSYKNIISDKTFDSFIIIVSPSQRETPLYKHIISNLPEWANLLSYVYRSFFLWVVLEKRLSKVGQVKTKIRQMSVSSEMASQT